jgi:pimeloyl-ACP methyl ester carboxylesterase
MESKKTTLTLIDHKQVNVSGISVHVAATGNKDNQTMLFLHGYPENWKAVEGVH